MSMQRTNLPRSVSGVPWDGLSLTVDGPVRPPLRDLEGEAKQQVIDAMAAIAASPDAGLKAHAA